MGTEKDSSLVTASDIEALRAELQAMTVAKLRTFLKARRGSLAAGSVGNQR